MRHIIAIVILLAACRGPGDDYDFDAGQGDSSAEADVECTMFPHCLDCEEGAVVCFGGSSIIVCQYNGCCGNWVLLEECYPNECRGDECVWVP